MVPDWKYNDIQNELKIILTSSILVFNPWIGLSHYLICCGELLMVFMGRYFVILAALCDNKNGHAPLRIDLMNTDMLIFF